jgi:hypothetical protein
LPSSIESPINGSMTIRRVLVVLAVWNVCGAAYIDPGATSLVWQVIVSGIVGIGFTLRSRITSLLQRLRNRSRDETPVPPTNEHDAD